jgi:myo-inositol-1(or 4)-monophosphatase
VREDAGVEDDPQTLLALADALARAAGTVLRDRPAALDVDAKSTPTDIVTERDQAAERVILAELRKVRPDDAVLAEETGSTPGRGDVTWVIDPLDGTVNYLYGIPHYAVSIAARVGDVEVAGVVYDVCRDQMYAATRGGGASCDGTPLRVSHQADPAFALTATGFAYASETRAAQADVLRTVLPRVRDVRRIGSAALDLCAVAAGRVDAFFEMGMLPWDWAAGSLIAREAGAVVAGLGGRPPGTWTTLVANPALFGPMEALLQQAGSAAVDALAGFGPAVS